MINRYKMTMILYINEWCYTMITGIPHNIPFGMCHVGCKGISHEHVVCFLTIWYAFVTMRYAYSKPQKTLIYDI